MNRKWEKHLSQVKRINAYCLEALFIFKKQKIQIIVVYIPHNDQKTRKDIQQQVIRRIYDCRRKAIKIIVLGDLNDIRCKNLDQSREDSKRTQKLFLLNWLRNSDMVDIFRKLHPYEKKFTRSNDQVKFRIDYIWTSKDLGQGLISYKITESDTITNSDYAIVSASIATGIMKKSRTAACDKRLKGKKWVFNLNKATEENWGDYKAKLDNMLKEKLVSKKGKKKDNSTRLEAISKDELWDLISISIIKCARATLLGKKIILGKTSSKKEKNVSDIMKRDLKKIGKMCQQCVAGMGQQISDMNRTNINLQITNLNNTYETEIEELSETVWSKKRLENLKIWWKFIYTKVQQARKKEDLEEINLAVEQRCEAIQGELKHMISSLLERSSRRVIIDRIIKKDDSDITLLNQRNVVLEEVRDHFQKQFRKRNTRSTNLPEQWEEAYKPLRKVDTKIYDSLENEVSEKEWTEALRRTKSKSAPGPSGISYPLIKKVEPIVQKVFRHLANLYIGEGEIPVKWK